LKQFSTASLELRLGDKPFPLDGGGGVVSKDTSKDIDGAPSEQANSKDREANGPTRAVRDRRPNSRVSDPEWVA
jgi:hypothetical protein